MAPTTRSQANTPSRRKRTSNSSSSPSATSRSPSISPNKLNSTSSTTATSYSHSNNKPNLVILGTGWAGWTLAQKLSSPSSPLTKTHNITILSPHRTMALTPLLASAACSIFDFRIAEEPVRRLGMSEAVQKFQVHCVDVDFVARKVRCKPAVGSNGNARSPNGRTDDGKGEFNVDFDTLILAPGSETNTFDTPGVLEHCYMMKSVADAMELRERMLDCLELACLPTTSERKKRDLLHFVIVGGGPTGVELAAELDELIHGHLSKIYPGVKEYVDISVYDVADRMLGMFDEKLSEYAMEKFKKRDVNICMGRHIEKFEEGKMFVKEDGEVGFGACVWAAGNKACELVERMDVRKTEGGMERIVTDNFLRVLKSSEKDGNEEFIEGVYALGDAAGILDSSHPPTAEVAVQKAEYLAKMLMSSEEPAPFEYKQKALVAYIGRKDGVVSGKTDWTGAGAWLAWRSGNLEWTRSWRRRTMIWVYWALNKLDGREIARR